MTGGMPPCYILDKSRPYIFRCGCDRITTLHAVFCVYADAINRVPTLRKLPLPDGLVEHCSGGYRYVERANLTQYGYVRLFVA